MIISEEEKNRIRGLHKNYSIINETVPQSGVMGVEAPESESALYSYDKDLGEMKKDTHEDSEGEETFNYGEDEGEDRKEEEGLEREEDMAPNDRLDAIEKHLDALRKDMSYDEDREDRGEEGTQFESVSAKKKR
jgi:hypothetical protein|tara:strand:+ start:1213 stop:1614 length:402 start_codon:yes stop_codon:yes gene_type:complete